MSDALTEIARDQKRNELYLRYVDLLVEFLNDSTAERKDAVIEAATSVDEVIGGYFGARTGFSQGLEDGLESLANKDRGAWDRFLPTYEGDSEVLARLKPFAPKPN
jgi:hypothetical protein